MPRYVLWHFRGLQTIAIDKLLLLFSLRSTFFPIEKACSGNVYLRALSKNLDLIYRSKNNNYIQFSLFFVSNSLRPHGLQHTRLPCSSPAPWACSNSCPTSRWCHPTTHPMSSPSPPAFSHSQNQGLFQWVTPLHQVTKVLELQLQHQSFQWIFRVDFL